MKILNENEIISQLKKGEYGNSVSVPVIWAFMLPLYIKNQEDIINNGAKPQIDYFTNYESVKNNESKLLKVIFEKTEDTTKFDHYKKVIFFSNEGFELRKAIDYSDNYDLSYEDDEDDITDSVSKPVISEEEEFWGSIDHFYVSELDSGTTVQVYSIDRNNSKTLIDEKPVENNSVRFEAPQNTDKIQVVFYRFGEQLVREFKPVGDNDKIVFCSQSTIVGDLERHGKYTIEIPARKRLTYTGDISEEGFFSEKIEEKYTGTVTIFVELPKKETKYTSDFNIPNLKLEEAMGVRAIKLIYLSSLGAITVVTEPENPHEFLRYLAYNEGFYRQFNEKRGNELGGRILWDYRDKLFRTFKQRFRSFIESKYPHHHIISDKMIEEDGLKPEEVEIIQNSVLSGCFSKELLNFEYEKGNYFIFPNSISKSLKMRNAREIVDVFGRELGIKME